MSAEARRRGLAALALLLWPCAAQAQGARLPDGFVYLRDVEPGIAQDMRYAGADNFTGRPLPGYGAPECVLRRPAAVALKRVQADLARQNLSLKVYDCYRPARAVTAMARWAADGNATPDTSRFYPRLKKDRLFALGFIASESAHSRGVAIDLTVVPLPTPPQPSYDARTRYGACTEPLPARAPDNSLDMGTGYDCFDSRSATRDPSITPQQRANRAILVEAMQRHGFANYRREWWHFSYPAADTGAAYDVPIRPR